jgi:MRG-binding protein
MHKHFRMIALSEHLRNHGYKSEPHTRIPGIWAKLRTLYNLDLIDQRENVLDFGEEDGEEKYLEFSLPESEFGEAMWMKGRVGSEAASSPPQINEPSKKRKRGDNLPATRASTIDDTDEAQTSPAPSSALRANRSGRGRKKAAGRPKEASERQPSKDTTMDEDEETKDEKTEDETNEEDGDEDGSPTPRASRSTKTGKGASARGQSKTRKSRRRK